MKKLLLISLAFLLFANLASYSQTSKNKEILELKNQIRELTDQNIKLEMKIDNMEKNFHEYTNRIDSLIYILIVANFSEGSDDNRRYTLSFRHITNHFIFFDLESVAKSNNCYFEYKNEDNSYSGEIGLFKSIEEALNFKAKLPKGTLYKIKQIE